MGQKGGREGEFKEWHCNVKWLNLKERWVLYFPSHPSLLFSPSLSIPE